MAQRFVYMVSNRPPYYGTYIAEFAWNAGFAVSQKRKNIEAMHRAFARAYPEMRVLEISGSSEQALGRALSAFSLQKYVPELGASIPVENVFQGGKVFENGGPFADLYGVTPLKAKRDGRLRSSGRITGFRFDGRDFPSEPKTAFYDHLYMTALTENPELAKLALEYDAFTDVSFNPDRSVNCQAKAAALFVSLHRAGLAECAARFDDMVKLVTKR